VHGIAAVKKERENGFRNCRSEIRSLEIWSRAIRTGSIGEAQQPKIGVFKNTIDKLSGELARKIGAQHFCGKEMRTAL
jgi:hypothetical protein